MIIIGYLLIEIKRIMLRKVQGCEIKIGFDKCNCLIGQFLFDIELLMIFKFIIFFVIFLVV